MFLWRQILRMGLCVIYLKIETLCLYDCGKMIALNKEERLFYLKLKQNPMRPPQAACSHSNDVNNTGVFAANETFYYLPDWFEKTTESRGTQRNNNDSLCPARPTGAAGTQLRKR